MKSNLLPGISGATLALMAAGMAMSGTTMAGARAHGTVALAHCSGVNQCKGHNDCKTADNACKGQGSCKGQGYVLASTAACGNLGGKVIDPGQSVAVKVSSQVHCQGVNSCKGHNDCKTASNACKGQGTCKGKGFVAVPAATCSNIGGTAG